LVLFFQKGTCFLLLSQSGESMRFRGIARAGVALAVLCLAGCGGEKPMAVTIEKPPASATTQQSPH
jgi:hypothetical protein